MLAQISALIFLLMENVTNIRLVGCSIAEHFPYECMADVCSRGKEYVVGMKDNNLFLVARGNSLSLGEHHGNL